MNQLCLSTGNLYTLQRSLEFPHAFVRRHLADAHWEPAVPAVHAHQGARREVLALDFRWGPRELAAFDRTGDDAAGADPRLVVICLRWRSTEWANVAAVDDLGVEGELSPTLPCKPGHNLAHSEWLLAGIARCRLHR